MARKPGIGIEDSESRLPGGAASPQSNHQSHFAQHVLHGRTHVIRDHRFHFVLPEETGDAGVVSPLGSSIVEAVPADIDLLPAFDAVLGHSGDGHALCPSPAWINVAARSKRDANDHANLARQEA